MEELCSIETIWEELGDRVRILREREGLSQEKLALMVDIDRTYLLDLEKGRRNASIESLVKLSRGLDITLSELLFNIDPSNPDQGADYAFVKIPRQ